TRPGDKVTHGTASFELPILYFHDDVFGLLFGADFNRVREFMPSKRLHPVRLPGGRAIAGIFAMNYHETTVGPYGELAVAVPVVHAPKAPLPLIPLIMEAGYPGFGLLILHLPVTTLGARDGGRGAWGFTKFTSDMVFTLTPEFMECRLSEKGRYILTLRVARQGVALRDRKPLVTYTVKEKRLIRTTIPQKGTQRLALRPRDSFLELGDHPVAESIRRLGLSDRPFISRYYMERSGILPKGEVIEEGVHTLEGYYGHEREGTIETRYIV
ncbi:MAG TPA: acetoacetate decarboxylase family protein, partial [Geobacteraceae bacterium]|nr:acetoacetate decarboxylase family protein [Geobacteraceae bacterium]